MKVAIIGGGSWATAIVKIITESNQKVDWWLRKEALVEHLKTYGNNPNYLSSITFTEDLINPSSDLKEIVRANDILFLAVPAAFLEKTFENISRNDLLNKTIISAVKGVIPSSGLIVSDWLSEKFQVPIDHQGVVGGPCHAEEVARERDSYLTIASPNMQLTEQIKQLLDCRFIRCSSLNDLHGVEYAAVMKNIYAIASGIVHGMGFGDNFQAVLVSNAMQEINIFLNKVNPRERNTFASAYLGDLLVTSYSQFSRNRTFGNMLGRGYNVKAAQLEMKMIAEGFFAIKPIYELQKRQGLNLPICNFVFDIIHNNTPPRKAFQLLRTSLR